MTVTVETGAGVRLANSYVPVAFVTAYLTERNRETDWVAAGTTIQEASVIAGTDYLDWRWGPRTKGTREFTFAAEAATATFTVSGGVPSDGETFVLGDETYTFRTALTSPAVANEVLVGADEAETASNVADAVNQDATNEGTTYSTGTVQSRHATAEASAGVVTLTALADGASGNYTVLTTAATNTAVTAFTGGLDGGSQPLYFPQLGLYDRAGNRVLGVPLRWKQAAAEYADRARVALLAPDPLVDDYGASVKARSEEVGPIKESFEYVEGTHLRNLIRPYPAADKLVQEYVFPPGGAVR